MRFKSQGVAVDMLIKSWNQLETWVFEAAGAITSSVEVENIFEKPSYLVG